MSTTHKSVIMALRHYFTTGENASPTSTRDMLDFKNAHADWDKAKREYQAELESYGYVIEP